MRKIVLSAIAMFAFIQISFAQTPWYLAGNAGTNPLTQYLGTTDNNPIIFRTWAAERMRITSSGLFGIGLTAPTAKFDLLMPSNFLTTLESGIRITYPAMAAEPPVMNTSMFEIRSVLSGNYSSKFVVKENGRVGIGTQTPEAGFHVLSGHSTSMKIETVGVNNADLAFKSGTNQSDILTYNSSGVLSSILRFNNTVTGTSLTLTSYASGTPTDNFKISETGTLYSKEIIVQASAFPDYVFAKGYHLMPLEKVNLFIQSNQHLPNIPSAKEIEENGIAVGEMQVKQMEKIEELYLYAIELNAEMKKLKEQNESLQKRIVELESK